MRTCLWKGRGCVWKGGKGEGGGGREGWLPGARRPMGHGSARVGAPKVGTTLWPRNGQRQSQDLKVCNTV